MFDNAPDHIARELLPIHSRKRLVERGEDALVGPVRNAAQHAFEHQCFESFDDHAPTHLDGGGGPDPLGDYFEIHAVRREQIGELPRIGAAQKHRDGGPRGAGTGDMTAASTKRAPRDSIVRPMVCLSAGETEFKSA